MAVFEGEMLATRELRVGIGGDYRLLRDKYPDKPLLREGEFNRHDFYFHGPISRHTHAGYVNYQERLREAL